MPRLKAPNGVIVNVDDATAERLGSTWKPADEPAPRRPEAKKAAEPVEK